MRFKDELSNEYFEWMCSIVCGNRFSRNISYRKLLMHLHNTKFRYSIPKDENRAEDGVDLRYRFTILHGYSDYEYEDTSEYLNEPCSVLEMMVALAIRCEESIMDNTDFGDRTGQWFWEMIVSLGLGSMSDDTFDRVYVENTIERFLNREYEPNGKGGLFTIKNCDRDLRTMEIWFQLCYYLDTII